MAEYISWFATAATILAALVTASNLGARITGYGFIIFLSGSIAWLGTALLTDQPALLWTNGVLTLLNIWGIWRWLGRQATLEEGADVALKSSLETPGEALLAASLLSRCSVVDQHGNDWGHGVDAMIGSESGRIHYLVLSQGGVGGVGERLHRLAWSPSVFDPGSTSLRIPRRQLERLPEISRDQWPAR